MFLADKHVSYIKRVSEDTESLEYVLTDYMRMSGVYWGLTALALLGRDLWTEMDGEALVEWVASCQHTSGGFGGSEEHDPHILYTLSAVQVLALLGVLDKIDREGAARYAASLQRADGSFAGDEWGEIDTRFSYCALATLAILGRLELVDIDSAAAFVGQCRNFDGGYGSVPGAESHAGQVFCCVGALAIAGKIDTVERQLLGWWLAERQCDSGGLNGRPEKQADVCYSWWILSSLCMLGCQHWIDSDALARFILDCQDADDGGIADRPGNVADVSLIVVAHAVERFAAQVFHTFFGIGGLSLLHWFDDTPGRIDRPHKNIDPVFALPNNIVRELKLQATVFIYSPETTLFTHTPPTVTYDHIQSFTEAPASSSGASPINPSVETC